MNNVQVLLYTSYLHVIGGIETFVKNYIEVMAPYYDIGLYCPQMPAEMATELAQKVPVYRDKDTEVTCNTLIMIRMMDEIPKRIQYKKSVRMCHACRTNPAWVIRKDCDTIVHVSEASKKSFRTDGEVILNPLIKKERTVLFLVSATRIPATDKGKNSDRMLKLANMLGDSGIPFVWLNFSDAPLDDAPHGLFNVGMTQDIQAYIQKADYLVQLSDHEGFGYSVAEALNNHTAVICTPFETTAELGVVDGKNGYIVPYDMRFDVEKLLDVPEFEYEYSNEDIVKQWRKLLGNTKPKHSYRPPEYVEVVVTIAEYRDMMLRKVLHHGDRLSMPYDRANLLEDRNFVKILKTIH